MTKSSAHSRGAHGKITTLTAEKVLELTCTTQKKAAKRLGCSLSTLKRRFHEIGEKWPYQVMDDFEKKQHIYYYINYKDLDEKYLSPETIKFLNEVNKQGKVNMTKTGSSDLQHEITLKKISLK